MCVVVLIIMSAVLIKMKLKIHTELMSANDVTKVSRRLSFSVNVETTENVAYTTVNSRK